MRKGTILVPRFDTSVVGDTYGDDEVIGAAFRLPVGLTGSRQRHWFVVVRRSRDVRVVRLNYLRVLHPSTSTSRLALNKREYTSWRGMLERCRNPKHDSASRYSQRGITVCDRWKDSFPNFLEDTGPRKDNETIERIDNNRGYEPSNCRWATMKEQRRNQNSRLIWFEKDGLRMCLADWCARLNVPWGRVHQRIQRGRSIEAALFWKGRTSHSSVADRADSADVATIKR